MRSIVLRVVSDPRLRLYVAIFASCLISYTLVAFRIWYYDSIEFGFMTWNLMLAAIPFAVSQWLVARPPKKLIALAVGIGLWLLFFPNAPYMLTDVPHVNRGPAPVWFDLVMLMSFAWNGLMLGYLSLLAIHRLVDERFGSVAGWSFAGSAIVLGSVGVYIGRYLRWNSWDLLVRPGRVLEDVGTQILQPTGSPTIYGVTILFSAFLIAGYLMLRVLLQSERLDARLPRRL